MGDPLTDLRLRELEETCARLGAQVAALEARILVQRRIDVHAVGAASDASPPFHFSGANRFSVIPAPSEEDSENRPPPESDDTAAGLAP